MVAVGMLLLLGLLPAANDVSLPEKRELLIVDKSYPAESLKAGEEGTVFFDAKLNKDGKIYSCVVTESSGYPRLDQATCDMIVRTARFKLKKQDGRRAQRIQSAYIEWKLPPGYAKGASPASAEDTSDETLADEKIICKRSYTAGSIIIKKKVCLTQKSWDRAADYAREEAIRLQTGSSGGTE